MKREDKVAKRKKKLAKEAAKKAAKKIRTAPVGMRPKNPYPNEESVAEDLELLRQAWEIHYGELSDDFTPLSFAKTKKG